MLIYLLKRILYFIPTFLFISLIIFFLSKCAGEQLACEAAPIYSEVDCIKEANLKGYNKPIFYATLSTAAHPDTLYRIFREERRIMLHKLVGQYGNWPPIHRYYQQLQVVEHAVEKKGRRYNSQSIVNMRKAIQQLYIKYKDPAIESQLQNLETAAADSLVQDLQPAVAKLLQAYATIKATATPNQLWIPSVQWHGFDNQYQHWVSHFLRGDLGISNRDGRSVATKILDRLPWTLAITLPAIFLAYLLSIPLGVYTAVYKDTTFDKRTSFILLLLFSLPVFWIATLLVNFFTTPEYGMKIFPSIGISSLPDNTPIWQVLLANAGHLILPIICATYGSLAIITRQLRSSMVETLQQDFIKTARAKGLRANTVIWKHAFRNSIFPLITIFGGVLPAAFAGSVVLEVIFNIPGMGYLMWDSIFARDWQVVYAVLMVSAVLTVVGILLADILYAVVDPRVRFGK